MTISEKIATLRKQINEGNKRIIVLEAEIQSQVKELSEMFGIKKQISVSALLEVARKRMNELEQELQEKSDQLNKSIAQLEELLSE
jgi:hypothetical protein